MIPSLFGAHPKHGANGLWFGAGETFEHGFRHAFAWELIHERIQTLIGGAACYQPRMTRDVSSAEPERASAVATSRTVVVFDFDGTLVNRDSFSDFAVRYCLRRPIRLLLVGALLPLALLVALRSQRRAGSLLLWAMTFGGSTRGFAVALRTYARRTLPGYANEAIFAELARHVQAGSRVVIATGTMPLLVRSLLGVRNFGPVPVVGSRVRRRFGGLVAETHCTGRTKVRELERKLGIVEWSAVYTDSFADRSLLSGARDITLVAPSSRTLLRTQRLIDEATLLRVVRAG